jgi:photosynthetic reaction center cytochrome c subunit
MRQTTPATNARDFSKRRACFLIVLFGVTISGFLSVQKSSVTATKNESSTSTESPIEPQKARDTKTAEQVYKNIQVFKGISAAEVEPAMAFISGSLGVKCNYCHVSPFDKDDKPTKQTARQMIRMVFDLNKGSFKGEKAVSCYTCHRGKPQPVSVPAVGPNLWQPNPPPVKDNPLPTVDQILDRYVQVLGGVRAFQKVTSRVAKGSRIGADGVLVPEDVYQKAPNKILTVTTYPDVAFSTGFNGSAGWGSSSKEGLRELPPQVVAQLKIDSDFYKEIRTKELYQKLILVGKSTIGDSEVYVIDASPFNGSHEKLFFAVRTGLLVRRYLESETVLGMFPLQIDYEDYRDVDGIKQPFLIRWSMPGRSWGRKIEEMKQNVEIDDARFNPPSPKG